MGKSGNHKKENTFRFQTFSERIANVNIDVIHQIRHHDDTPEETSTYFGDTLERLSELNCTDHFTAFRREISEQVRTFAQLVHHEETIVSALKKHLQIPKSMAMPALLELVVQLARDLQMDFYRHFREFFDILVTLLNVYTQDVEILEHTFTSLSFIFKFLWRYLVKDIQQVYGYFSALLSKKYKEYVRNFAAESFAFLMRKVKDQSSLFDFMLATLNEEPDKSEGVGRLLFEMMKGVKGQFHSCVTKVLPILLQKLGPQDKQASDMLPWQQVEDCLATTFTSMATHSDKEHMSEVWQIVLSSVSDCHTRYVKTKQGKKKGQQSVADILERLLRLINMLIAYKKGSVITNPEDVGKVFLELLQGTSLPESAGLVLLDTLSSLLGTSHTRLPVEITSKLVHAVYNTSYTLDAVYNFTATLFDLPLFEMYVLPAILPYCQSTVAMATGSCDETVAMVTKLLLNKCPPLQDGSQLENMDTYMLDFTNGTKSFPDYMVSLIGPFCGVSDSSTQTTFSHRDKTNCWAALVCLPHIRPIAAKNKVVEDIGQCIERLLGSCHNDNELAIIGCQAMVTMVMMERNCEVFRHVDIDWIINALSKECDNVNLLRLADVYMTHAVDVGYQQVLHKDTFMKLFPLLEGNLSSHLAQVRLLTLRILSSYDLPLSTLNADFIDVFKICLCAETTSATIQDYRDKLRHIQKLEYTAVQNCIPSGPFSQVPLRYLIGCLFINFKLLWEPIRRLIATHAYGMDKTAFWDVYGKYLELAGMKAEESLQNANVRKTVSVGESGELPDSPVTSLFMECKLEHAGVKSVAADFTMFRNHLWLSMQEFANKCEPKSRMFVPLFFRFLANEYYLTDFSTAPTQNIVKKVKPEDKNSKQSVKTVKKPSISLKDGTDLSVLKNKTSENLKRTRTESSSSVENQENDLGIIKKRPRTRSQRVSESENEMDDSNQLRTSQRIRTRSQSSQNMEIEENEKSKEKVLNKTKIDGTEEIDESLEISHMEGIPEEEEENEEDLMNKMLNEESEQGGEYNKKGEGKKKRAATGSLVAHLKLFSKFRDPKSIYLEPKLKNLYLELLLHKNGEVQKVAFACLMTYKYRYLTAYRTNFERLLDDKTFKDEIVLFSIDSETSTISVDHRQDVLFILMRILYGKMHSKTGKNTQGKQHSSVRQSIVFRFLNGCSEQELKYFIDLVLAPFTQFLSTDNPYKMVKDLKENTDLTQMLPIKKIQGALNSINMIFKKLGHLLDSFLPSLLQVVMGMASLCGVCLDMENRDKVALYVINPLKTIRQLCVYRIIQVFNDYDQCKWRPVYIDAIFEAVIWPQLDKLSYEGLYTPTPLLKFLHCCTKNPRYFSLLAKHHDNDPSLTPLTHVFKLLLHKDVSKSVAAFIMHMVNNLLKDPEDEAEGQEVKVIEVNHMTQLSSADNVKESDVGIRLLLPYISDILVHIEKMVCKLHTQLNQKRNNFTELSILSRISCFVQDETVCKTLINLLLPYLGKKVSRSLKTEEDILLSITNLLRLVTNREPFFPAVSKLFASLGNRNSRTLLCDAFWVICENNAAKRTLSTIVRQMNSWDKKRVEEPDYMLRLEGFKSASSLLKSMVTMDTNICLALIYNCCYFISNVEDMSLRDSSTHCLATMVTQFGCDTYDTHAYNLVITGGLLSEVKLGIRSKSETVRHEFITILISLLDTFGNQPKYAELKALRDTKDLDGDFYENIKHIQMHKRARALRRLIKHLTTCNVNNLTLSCYFLPIVSAFLTDELYKKHPGVQEAAVDAIGQICRQLPWKNYLNQLKYYLQLLQKKLESQKLLVRVIVSILEGFHFDLSNSTLNMKLTPGVVVEVEEKKEEKSTEETTPEAKVKPVEDFESPIIDDEETMVTEINEAGEEEVVEITSKGIQLCSANMATKIHGVILNSVVAQLHKILTQKIRSEEEHKLARSNFAEDDEILRVPISLAMVKLLQKLPKGALEKYLPGILLKVCNFLKSRSNDIRNTSRDTIVNIQLTLGPRYFPFILSEMKGILRRGYQVHVLCFTVHLLLKNMEDTVKPGDIDVCLKSLQEVFNMEIFGDVAEEKDVAGIKAKTFEARTSKSYESYNLISRYISKTSLMTLIDPLKLILDTTHSHKSARKVQDVLKKVVSGLMENKDLTTETLLVFVHGLTTQSLPNIMEKSEKTEKKVVDKPGKRPESCLLLPEAAPRGGLKPKTSKKTNIYVLVEFGLQLLNMCLRRQKVVSMDTEHLQMLDPLVPMLGECLFSKYIQVNSASLRCLCWVLKFPLPALKTSITKISSGLFILLKNYASAGAMKGDNLEMVAMLFKAVTVLVRDVKFHKIDTSKLHVLLTFCEADIHDYNRRSTAFSLLKAILSRKLNIPEVHELMVKVREMSITAETAHVQRECRQVMLQYMLDYSLGKQFESHLEFYITQLSYERETGRESALEMMAVFFNSMQNLLADYADLFFIPMAANLVNDESPKCRKLTALAIKSLLGKLDHNNRTKLFSIVTKWFMDAKLKHRTLASQLCGLFVEVEGGKFESRMAEVLPILEQQLEPGKYGKTDGEAEEQNLDHMLYNTLNTLIKILRECTTVITNSKWDNHMSVIWEHVQSHLTYPHIWVQLASSQLFGLLFAAWQPDQLVAMTTKSSTHFLTADLPRKLRSLALDLITQFQSELLNEDLAQQIVKNMIFLSKCAKLMSSKDEGGATDDSSQSEKIFTLTWLIKKILREAHHEAIFNTKSSIKRMHTFKWMAALSLEVGASMSPEILKMMISPLIREIKDEAVTQDQALKSLAQEVLEMLKKIVDIEQFTTTYATSQKFRAERKDERKKNRAVQAVSNPEGAAKRKLKKNLAKKESKKRRVEVMRPSKNTKKRKYEQFNVGD